MYDVKSKDVQCPGHGGRFGERGSMPTGILAWRGWSLASLVFMLSARRSPIRNNVDLRGIA